MRIATRSRGRWILVGLLLALAALLPTWGVSMPAQGQTVVTPTPSATPTVTATPTPTATATATPVPVPSAKSVIKAATKRLRRAGSGRFTLTGTFTAPTQHSGTETVNLTGRSDVSSTQHHVHSIETTSGVGATERDESIQIGRWSADRVNKNPWLCTHAKKLNEQTFDLGSLFTLLKPPYTITPAIVDGTPVWKIQAKYSDAASSESGKSSYDITQTDDTLIQGSVKLRAAPPDVPTLHISFKFTVSRLGERVTVKLPASCHATAALTAVSPLRLLPLSFTPVRERS